MLALGGTGMSEPTRKVLLACLALVFLIFGAIVTYWAYGNAVMWYHDTYIEPDASAAEADAVLLWIQVPTALVSWIVGGVFVRKVLRYSEQPK